MGIVHDNGYASILVPGAGQANFDAFEANPFESLTQRKEKLVHGLMEKLDPATISVKLTQSVTSTMPHLKSSQKNCEKNKIAKSKKTAKRKRKSPRK